MNQSSAPTDSPYERGFYAIRLKGHLDNRWAGWFEGMTIVLENDGVTLLTGPVFDQAELHGLFRKIRDLGMPLISVNRIDPGQANAQQTH